MAEKQFFLKQGKSQNLNEEALSFSNSLAVSTKFFLTSVPFALLRILSKITVLLYAFLGILELTGIFESPWNPKSWICTTAFYALVSLAIELKYQFKIFFDLRNVDNLRASKGDPSSPNWTQASYSSLKVGDIVCVWKDQQAPADVIVLDCSDKIQGSVACIVNTSLVSGMKESRIKKAIQNTQTMKYYSQENGQTITRIPLKKYLNGLTGKFFGEYPTSDLTSFSGAIKLKNDPKTAVASIDNLILRGSVMKSEWAIGVVIYTGYSTKCLYEDWFFKIKPASYLRRHVLTLLITLTVGYIGFILVSFLLELALGYNDSLSWKRFVSLYLPVVPLDIWFVLEIGLLLNKLLIERESKRILKKSEEVSNKIEPLGSPRVKEKEKKSFQRKPIVKKDEKDPKVINMAIQEAQSSKMFEVYDPEAICDLGLAEYAIFDKTGTIVTNDFQIKSIATLTRRYLITPASLEQRVKEIDLIPPSEDSSSKKFQVIPIVPENETIALPETYQVIPPNFDPNEPGSGEFSLGDDNEPNFLSQAIEDIKKNFKEREEHDGKNPFNQRNMSDMENVSAIEKTPGYSGELGGLMSPKDSEGNRGQNEEMRMDQSGINKNNTAKASKMVQSEIAMTPQEDLSETKFSFGLIQSKKGNYISGASSKIVDQEKAKKSFLVNFNQEGLGLDYELEKNYQEDDLFNDVASGEEGISLFFTVLSICHDAIVKNNEGTRTFESPLSGEEEAALQLANTLGFNLLSREVFQKFDESRLGWLKIRNRFGKKKKYDILGIIPPTPKRNRFTIVLFDLKYKKVVILCKGQPYAIKDCVFWTEDEKQTYSNLLSKNNDEGLKTVVYGRRVLTESQASSFSKKFRIAKTNLLNSEEAMEEIAIEIEKDLTFTGILGFKDLIRPDAQVCIRTLKQSGLRLWLLTGDNYGNAINAAFHSELLPENNTQVVFDFQTKDTGKSEFRTIFEKMFEKGSPICSFTFVINGMTVNAIRNSNFLTRHFRFLLYSCECMVGYSLNPDQKEFLVSSLRSIRWGDEPFITVIGDGFNDFQMMRVSHFGIQVKNQETPGLINFGDATTPSLSYFASLFQVRLKNFTQNIYIVIDYIVYSAMFNGFMLFFQQAFTGFSGTVQYGVYFQYIELNVFQVVPCLLFLFLNEPFDRKLVQSSPEVHQECIYIRYKVTKCFLYSLVLALVQTLIFHVGNRIITRAGINPFTFPIDLEELVTTNHVFTTIVPKFRLAFLTNSQIGLFSAIGFIWFGFILLATVIFNAFDQQFLADRGLFRYFSYHDSKVGVFGLSCTFFCIGICYLFERIILPLTDSWCFSSIRYKTPEELKKGGFLKKIQKADQIFDIVLTCFEKLEKVDVFLLRTMRNLESSMKNPLEMKLSKYLLQYKGKGVSGLYKIHFVFTRKIWLNIWGFLVIVGCLIVTLTQFAYNPKYGSYDGGIQFLPVVALLALWIFIITSWEYKARFGFYLQLFITFLVVSRIVINIISRPEQLLITLDIVPIAATYTRLPYLVVWAFFLVEGIVFFVMLLLNEDEIFLAGDVNDYLFIFFGFMALTTAIKFVEGQYLYFQEKISKKNFLFFTLFQENSEFGKELLSLLMPKFILNRLKTYSVNENMIADEAGSVTILFCDISDFDLIVKAYNDRIVRLIDEIFRQFDVLCRKYGVQKIETVGKTYMAVGGLNLVEQKLPFELRTINSTKRVLDLAKDMLRYAESLTLDDGLSLKLKIGINYGDAIFGVIGYHKPQFSLIGDVVNTSSRLCTTGTDGCIMLSKSAWKMVKSKKINYSIQNTQMKGLGAVKVYMICLNQEKEKQNYMEVIETTKKRRETQEQSRPSIEDRNKKAPLQSLNALMQGMTIDDGETATKAAERIGSIQKNIIFKRMTTMSNRKGIVSGALVSKQQIHGKGGPLEPENSGKADLASGSSPKDEFYSGASQIDSIRESKKENESSLKEVAQKPSETIEESVNDIDDDVNGQRQLRFNRFLLYFPPSQDTISRKFALKLFNKYGRFSMTSILICQIVLLLSTILSVVLVPEASKAPWVIFSIRILFIWAGVIPVIFMKRIFLESFWSIVLACYGGFFQLFILLSLLATEDYYRNQLMYMSVPLFESELIFICFSLSFAMDFKSVFFWRGASTVLSILIVLPLKFFVFGEQIFLIYQVFSATCLLWQKYTVWRGLIKSFNNNIYSGVKDAQIDNFVDRLLPKHVQRNIGNPVSEYGDVLDDVTLLFADIVGFTKYSAGKSPQEVVNLLSKLFTEFDKECLKLGLYKMYTIGDCYVVMSTTDKDFRMSAREECELVVKLALSMISVITTVRKALNYEDLHMRIGIHTVRQAFLGFDGGRSI